jgi:uncharacterized protein (TIGR03067 family)
MELVRRLPAYELHLAVPGQARDLDEEHIMITQWLIVLTVCVPPSAGVAPPTGDEARLQGTWKVVSLESDGQPAPAEATKGAELIFEGNHYALKGGTEQFRGTFRLDATRTPRAIDATFTEPDGKEKGKAVGIYKLEGDRLTICWHQDGKERPATFRTARDSNLRLIVAERVKP